MVFVRQVAGRRVNIGSVERIVAARRTVEVVRSESAFMGEGPFTRRSPKFGPAAQLESGAFTGDKQLTGLP